MFTVVIDYGGKRLIERYKSEKLARRRYAGWYTHGLDMCGQVSSEFWLFDKSEMCILHDRY